MAALVIRLLSDAWFTIDIAINFRTGIVVEGSNRKGLNLIFTLALFLLQRTNFIMKPSK